MEPEIYPIQRYEHLRKTRKRQPIPLVISMNGIVLNEGRDSTLDYSKLSGRHPFLDLNLDEFLGF